MTSNSAQGAAAPFGTVLGMAPGNVPVYSCDYASADETQFATRQAYRSYVDDVYMGHKWQCVEFARRWLYQNYGYVFDDVAMAYDVFRLKTVRDIRNDRLLPLRSFRNGSKRRPEPGCLLIWEEGGEFETTGHIAIVTEVTDECVRLAEQNVDNSIWPPGRNYNREVRAQASPDGRYWLECTFGDASILGWVIQTDDDTHAERIIEPDARMFRIVARELKLDEAMRDDAWLNVANRDEAAYVDMMGAHRLSGREQDLNKYYCITETALRELQRATNELHAFFMHATDYVLSDESRLEPFDLPRVLWPRIRQSWENRRNQMITGRFDFSLSEQGVKVYEYNCDSASCHIETGKIQGKWAKHFGCNEGSDPGDLLQKRLRDAWTHSDVTGKLHILRDDDPEEAYHALFMQETMRKAGIESRIVTGTDELQWDKDGIVDADGTPVKWVWKTWSWETALDQIRAELEDDERALRNVGGGQARSRQPRLVDVLLREEIQVYEPLWTLVPSNKAILPVLASMFPEYPYLLNSSYELTKTLKKSGFVVKPIVGRGGANIKIVDPNDELDTQTSGAFSNRDQIYQALCPLPQAGGYFVQVSTFSAAGRYAGACLRVDESPVINIASENIALRIVADSAAETD